MKPFALINADDYYGPQGFKTLHNYLTSPDASVCIVAYILQNTLSGNGTVSRGVCSTSADGHLSAIAELTGIERKSDGSVRDDAGTDLDPDARVSMNMWGFSHAFLNSLDEKLNTFLKEHGTELKSELFLPLIVDERVKEEGLTVDMLESHDAWLGVTYPEDKAAVQDALKASKRFTTT